MEKILRLGDNPNRKSVMAIRCAFSRLTLEKILYQ